MRLALAALLLAFAVQASLAHAAPNAAPHPPPHKKVKPAPAAVVLRTEIVSGNNQTGHAYAEPAASKYVTEFSEPLVVRIVGWPREGGSRRVHFHCATPGVKFVPADQPNEGKDIDDRFESEPNTYRVHVTRGVASLKVAIESDRPNGTYTVTVKPGEPNSTEAAFTLTSR